MRSSSLAERLWNPNVVFAKAEVMKRIVAHQKLMNRRGIPTAPITSQECEIDPKKCAY